MTFLLNSELSRAIHYRVFGSLVATMFIGHIIKGLWLDGYRFASALLVASLIITVLLRYW